MKFSIIIAAYNNENFIEECIESVLNQSYKNYELIIIDDFSNDGTWEILKKYNGYKNIRIIRNDSNLGVSYTRNKGLSVAKGDWITFLDSDDWYEDNMLEYVCGKICQYPNVGVIQCNLMVHDKKGIHKYADLSEKVVNHNDKKELIESTISVSYGTAIYGSYGNCRCVGGKFYRKDSLKNIFFPEDLYTFEDGIFNIKTYLVCEDVLILDNPLYNYRRISTSTTRRYNPDLEKQQAKIIKHIRNLISDNKIYFNSYIYCIYEFMVADVYNFAGNKEYKNKIKNTKRIVKKNINQKALRKVKIKYLGKRYGGVYLLLNMRLYFLVCIMMDIIKKFID